MTTKSAVKAFESACSPSGFRDEYPINSTALKSMNFENLCWSAVFDPGFYQSQVGGGRGVGVGIGGGVRHLRRRSAVEGRQAGQREKEIRCGRISWHDKGPRYADITP